MALPQATIEELIQGFYEGKYSVFNLPEIVYIYNATQLDGMFFAGYGQIPRGAIKEIEKAVRKNANSTLISNPDSKKMLELIRGAQINILWTFQATGIKLKLLYSLYRGRHCVVNNEMIRNTGLDELCHIVDKPEGLQDKVEALFTEKIKEAEWKKRKEILEGEFLPENNATKLIESF